MVVCVAGPIAAGKNYVCSLLEARGFFCVDADSVIHKIIKEKEEEIFCAFKDDAALAGINLRACDKSLDRRALGTLLFKNHKLLERQEKILYPEFERRIQALIDSENSRPDAALSKAQNLDCGVGTADEGALPITGGQAAANDDGLPCERGLVINAALLCKTPKILLQCQKIIYVDAPLFVRLNRIIRRDKLSFANALRRAASQKNLCARYKRFATQNGIELIKVNNWRGGCCWPVKNSLQVRH